MNKSYSRLHFLYLGLIALVMMGSSCNTKKKVAETIEEEAPNDAVAFMDALILNQFQAEWLGASAHINYDDGSMSIGATANIKMQKDKVIWVAVKKFGFEAGRAKITPDSIYVLNRINKEYIAEPISMVAEMFDLPANLSMLQQIILGNPVFLTTSNPKGMQQNELYHLATSSDASENDFWFAMPDYQMHKMEVNQLTQKQSLSIELQDYKDAGGNRDFSYLRKIQAKSGTSSPATIEMSFSKVEVDVPQEIRFTIPDKYTQSKY